MHVKHALYRGGMCIFDGFSCTLTEKNPQGNGLHERLFAALTDMEAAQASQLVRSSRDHRDIGSKLSRNLAQCLGCFLHDRVFKDRP